MQEVTIRFLHPNSFSGFVASWRILEPYGHSVIMFGDRVYNALPPKVTTSDRNHISVAIPPRVGVDMSFKVTDEQAIIMEDWCKAQVGQWYDLLAVIGWFLYVPTISSKKKYYCFEFCREAFVQAGILPPSNDLITSERLMFELYKAFCTCGSAK